MRDSSCFRMIPNKWFNFHKTVYHSRLNFAHYFRGQMLARPYAANRLLLVSSRVVATDFVTLTWFWIEESFLTFARQYDIMNRSFNSVMESTKGIRAFNFGGTSSSDEIQCPCRIPIQFVENDQVESKLMKSLIFARCVMTEVPHRR